MAPLNLPEGVTLDSESIEGWTVESATLKFCRVKNADFLLLTFGGVGGGFQQRPNARHRRNEINYS